MKDTVSGKMLRFFQREFRDQYCAASSIKALSAFENGILEQTANINEALLSQRHQTNQQIIKTIKKRGANAEDIAGFYILYPLTSEGEKLIEDGDIRNSRQLAASHICESLSS